MDSVIKLYCYIVNTSNKYLRRWLRKTKEKVNELENSSIEKQTSQLCLQTEISIDDLPTELLEAVFEYASTEVLLNVRQVNSKWNELSSRTLRFRADKVLRFQFKKGHFRKKIIATSSLKGITYKNTSKTLNNLVDCMKRCKHFPFSYFEFEFRLTELNPINNVERLEKLLSEQLPNLKKLEIQFGERFDVSPSTELFFDTKKFKMPRLQLLVVNDRYKQFPGIVENILSAACNLMELESDLIDVEDLQMLQSLDKFHLVKKLEIRLSENLIAHWHKFLKNINLNLKSLRVRFDEIFENPELKVRATSILNQLLESSKDVVEMETEPLELLPGIVFPPFEKVKKFQAWEVPGHTFRLIFPASIEIAAVFPNLKELDLCRVGCDDFFPLLPNTSIPSVEFLRVFCTKSASKLMKMTPNVKTAYLESIYPWFPAVLKCDFTGGFRTVFNNLTKLETIRWKIFSGTAKESIFKLDAAITGFDEKCCEEMSKKFRNRDHLSASELASIEQLRKHSSIVDLKDLKQLNLHFIHHYYVKCYKKDEAGLPVTNKFFNTGFTKVSQLLSFNFIPKLEINVNIIDSQSP